MREFSAGTLRRCQPNIIRWWSKSLAEWKVSLIKLTNIQSMNRHFYRKNVGYQAVWQYFLYILIYIKYVSVVIEKQKNYSQNHLSTWRNTILKKIFQRQNNKPNIYKARFKVFEAWIFPIESWVTKLKFIYFVENLGNCFILIISVTQHPAHTQQLHCVCVLCSKFSSVILTTIPSFIKI